MRYVALLALPLALVTLGCEDPPPPDLEGLTAVASCVYVNQFSDAEECREYLGAAWDIDGAEIDCVGQDGDFAEGGCEYEEILGECVFDAGTDDVFQVVIPGSNEDDCSGNEVGCEVFGGGQFVAAETCGGLPDRDLQQGLVFVNPEELCVAPVADGFTGDPVSEDGEVCTWNSIQGCTEEGRFFGDYAQCDDVRSQRGYYEVSEDEFETAADDPILQDQAWLEEYAWVTEQVEACGCVCCHDSRITPDGGAGNWDINSQKPIWTDGMFASGLAFSAGWVDSSLLGFLPAEQNNGFGRDRAGVPSTDQDRMIAFFEGELARRGIERSQFEDAEPVPFVFYQQQNFEPEACRDGVGISRDNTVTWDGGDARYIYLLAEGSANPVTPPNFDEPEGTLWLLEVRWDEEPMESGLTYPAGPARASQRYTGPELVEGTDYYLYVQADVNAPITRCTFTY